MTSILTNTAAMGAASAIGVTQQSLATTQTQISTGLRVSSAADNPTYWSIASAMSTRVGQLKAVDDDLSLTSSIIATTNAALTNILSMAQKMSNLVVAAQSAGVDIPTIQGQIAGLQQGIVSAANAATFAGVNWLVTKVVGTNTTSDTRVDDVTYAQAQGLATTNAVGVDHEQATYTVNELTTRSLGSTSSSVDQQQNSVLFTRTGTSNAGVYATTTTASNQHSSATVSGDPTGYRTGQIPVSIAADGSISTSAQDLHAGELFQAFSGTSSVNSRDTYTDQVRTYSTPAVQGEQDPYVTYAQDDVLDTPFLTSSGMTTILQMVLSSPGDAAQAEPAVDTAIGGITKALAFYGGLQDEVDGSQRINETLIGAMTTGIGALVDADMNEASTRLAALQTQQQLGIQSLGVANTDAKAVLRLFGDG